MKGRAPRSGGAGNKGMDADPRSRGIEELEAENARLRAENESLKVEVQSLRQLVKQLQERTEEVERSAARQAAPFRRKDKDRKSPEKHGKPGHPPAHRNEPSQIDDHVEVRLTECLCCGGPVTDVEACEQFIEGLPPTRPHVTRLVT